MRTSPRALACIAAMAIGLLLAVPCTAHPQIEAQIAAQTRRIAGDPSNGSLYLRRGELYRIHGEFRAAEADYRRARVKDPDLAAVDLCIGQMLFDEGDLPAAAIALDRFLARAPDSVEGLALRARVRSSLGRHIEAANDWTAAIAKAGDPMSRAGTSTSRGTAGTGTGAPASRTHRPAADRDHREAIPAVPLTSATSPGRVEPEFYLERARALAAAGGDHLEEALRGLDDGLGRLGQPVSLQLFAIDLEVRLGRYERALQRLDRMPDPVPAGSPDRWMRRGRIFELSGRSDDARRAYAAALAGIEALPPTRRRTRAMIGIESEARASLAAAPASLAGPPAPLAASAPASSLPGALVSFTAAPPLCSPAGSPPSGVTRAAIPRLERVRATDMLSRSRSGPESRSEPLRLSWPDSGDPPPSVLARSREAAAPASHVSPGYAFLVPISHENRAFSTDTHPSRSHASSSIASSSAPTTLETVAVAFGSPMRYLANASNPGIGVSWTAAGFPDGTWAQGSYGVGYEAATGAQNLLLTTVPAGTSSVYTRARFSIADASSVQSPFLGADYDDGYIAWINGVEVYRSPQMPAGAPDWNTAAGLHESSNAQTPNYLPLQNVSAAGVPALHDGENVLAVGIWNAASSSSDLVLVPQLLVDKTVSVIRGPYLQMGTPSSVVVRWRTDAATDSRVSYGPSPGSLGSSVTAPALTTEHAVTLSGLQPGTRYFYAVGTTTGNLAGGDAAHVFRTSPPNGSSGTFRAWVLGDSGTANDDARAVRDAYTAFTGAVPTDLWLMLGDNAYQDGTDAEYQTAVFDTYPSMLRQSVLWPTFGNHDGHTADSATQTGPYYDLFTLPAAAEAGGTPSGTEAYYSFDYGNVHFVCLDSYESSRAPAGDMMTWLQQDLLATTRDWIVAFWHHPPYSKGSHDSDLELELVEMRENALPILEANGVDLVLCGHSHSYERSFLIDGHYDVSSTFSASNLIDGGDGRPGSDGAYQKPQIGPDPHEGAVYAVAGSSGQISGGLLDHPAMFLSLNALGSMVLDFEGNRLDAAFLDDAGMVRDSFTIEKGPPLAPAADFIGSPTAGPAPLSVAFVDRSTNGPTAWSWDFEGDGTVDSALPDPVRSYASPGLYTVALSVSNGAGSGNKVRTGYVCVRPAPAALVTTGLTVAPDRETLSWNPQPSGNTYDTVKGDLLALHQSQGDFTASLLVCLQNDGIAAQASDAQVPLAGGGFFYLVRAVDCAGSAGSFDTGVPSQIGSRDAEIAASPNACP